MTQYNGLNVTFSNSQLNKLICNKKCNWMNLKI